MSKKNRKQVKAVLEASAKFGRVIRPYVQQTGQEWVEAANREYQDTIGLPDRILRALSAEKITVCEAAEIDRLILNALHQTEPRFYVRSMLAGDQHGLFVMAEHDGHPETLRVWSGLFGPERAVNVEGTLMVLASEKLINLIIPGLAAARAGISSSPEGCDWMEPAYLPWVVQCKYKEKVLQGLSEAEKLVAA